MRSEMCLRVAKTPGAGIGRYGHDDVSAIFVRQRAYGRTEPVSRSTQSSQATSRSRSSCWPTKSTPGFHAKSASHDALQTVAPVVGAAQVRELVQADLIDFVFGKPLEQRARNQDHRIEEPDRDRHVDFVADAQPHLARTFIDWRPAGHRVAVLDRQAEARRA